MGTALAWFALQQLPTPIDSADPRQQWLPHLACDDQSGCTAAWSATDLNDEEVTSRWLYPDGGMGPVGGLGGLMSSTVLEGFGASRGARWYLYDVSGSGGDQNLYVAYTRDAGASAGTATISAIDPLAGTPGYGAICSGLSTNLVAHVTDRTGCCRKVRVRRVADDGGFPEADSVQIASGANHVVDPMVTSLNGTFYIVFLDRFDSNQFDPYLTLWSEANAPVLQHIQLAGTPNDEGFPTIAADTDHLLVAWEQWLPGSIEVDVYRVELDGGTSGKLLTFPSAESPHLSCRAGRCLLGYSEGLPDGGGQAVVTELVLADGGLLAQTLFSGTAGPSRRENWLAHESNQAALFLYGRDGPDGGSRLWLTRILVAAPDGGFDAGPDAGDSGLDAGADAGGGANDAGDGGATDAGAGGADAGDAGLDAGTDAGGGGTDAGDGGAAEGDAGLDAGADGGAGGLGGGDAGEADAASDGGHPTLAGKGLRVGCGCAGGPGSLAWGLVALAGLWRRRVR